MDEKERRWIILQQQISWYDSIGNLRGVGSKSIQKFAQLGIVTIKDLLFHFPFRYENIQARELSSILDEEKVTLLGQVVTQPTVSYYGRNKNRTQFKLAVSDEDVIQVVFFNQAYLAKAIQVGQERAIFGKWLESRQTLMGHKLLPMRSRDENFQSVYSLTKGLKQGQIIKIIEAAFDTYYPFIPEILPQVLNKKYRLISLKQALKQMHFPDSKASHHQAERKIIYLDFFLYHWKLQQAAFENIHRPGLQIKYDIESLKKVIQSLPFELTKAQKQAVNDICFDLLAPYSMRRMLQGEVGSGKTLVAFLGMIATIQAGYQVAMMVPTEILARQHVESFNSMFKEQGLCAECLVSSISESNKRDIHYDLVNGKIQLIIGTHALIQPQVRFKNLALVIIDEQHRFGVGQRQALIDKGQASQAVNLLQMTATPIPRSLALSLYGEMAVSTIDQLPQGRKPILTYSIEVEQISQLYDQLSIELSKGHQAYYILPLIDDSDELSQVESVNSIYNTLIKIFPEQNIGTLHGQMTKEEQRHVMESFVNQQVDILIATTMVEVGVNVPNATMMIIQSAERFGLAQLHQLRGRVGRGKAQSYCYLIGNPTTDQGKQRLEIMVTSQDGFHISQEDLRIRGMGDLLGRSQSGLPQFKYANIFEDHHILEVAREDALELITNPHQLSESEYLTLNQLNQETKIEI